MSAGKGEPCPIAGCTAHAKPNQLMCWPHWRRVPKALNRAVFETFAALNRRGGGGQKRPYAERRADYLQARNAAIAAVEAKEATEATNG